MLTPVFTHGTYENTIKAITEGKVRYPAYLWVTDRSQYGFLNKNNELEVIGIPEFTGTLENPIILSALNDGIYQVRGQHKITASHPTTFDSTAFILVMVQTTDNGKKVSRIAPDEIVRYYISDDLTVTSETYITDAYLEDYATKNYVDLKIVELKAEIVAEIEDLVIPIIKPVVIEVLNEELQPTDDQDIENLFN